MQMLNSKEVAEMMGVRHDNFLRNIRKYITVLGEDSAGEYFKSGSYKDTAGRGRLGYMITKKGCDFLASKLSMEKGEAFKVKVDALDWDEAIPTEPKAVVRNEPVEKVYSFKEVADILGITERSVRRYIQAGKMVAVEREVITTVRGISENDLNRFKKEREANG